MEINSLFDMFEHVLNAADGLHATHTDIHGKNQSQMCFNVKKKHIKMHLYMYRFLQLM